MAGIYIHIPFCRKKCNYCDFFSVVSTKKSNVYVQSLLKEIDFQKDYIKQKVETIYFGGGTPSILSIENIAQILDKIDSEYFVKNDAEITLEINPEDADISKISALRKTGINRLSIGIQSFNDEILQFLNRTHNAKNALNSIENAVKSGIENISIDLIYGIPGQSIDQWKSDLDIAFSSGIQHLSAYHLSFEPKTFFGIQLKKGKIREIDENLSFQFFEVLHEIAAKFGFDDYEISNFAKRNFYSKHNSNYWKMIPYLGLGASAHSFNGNSRQWNISNVSKYIESLENDIVPFELEILDKKSKINEYIMTSLRTSAGLNTAFLSENYGKKLSTKILQKIEKYLNSNHAVLQDEVIRLELSGKFISDKIITDLFEI